MCPGNALLSLPRLTLPPCCHVEVLPACASSPPGWSAMARGVTVFSRPPWKLHATRPVAGNCLSYFASSAHGLALVPRQAPLATCRSLRSVICRAIPASPGPRPSSFSLRISGSRPAASRTVAVFRKTVCTMLAHQRGQRHSADAGRLRFARWRGGVYNRCASRSGHGGGLIALPSLSPSSGSVVVPGIPAAETLAQASPACSALASAPRISPWR